jgi:hypothetical protein
MILGSHSCVHEEFHLLGYNSVQSSESQQTFRRNMWPPSSGSKNKPSKIAALHFPPFSYIIRKFAKPIVRLTTCFNGGFLLGLFLKPEDVDNMYSGNIGWLSTGYTALYLRRWNSLITHMPTNFTLNNLRWCKSSMIQAYLQELGQHSEHVEIVSVPIRVCLRPCRSSAVRRWLPTAAARVCVRAACGVCGGQSGTGAGFLRVLRFPLPIIPPIAPLS